MVKVGGEWRILCSKFCILLFISLLCISCSLVAVCELLIVAASLTAEHRL